MMFYLKKTASDRNGLSPVMGRITIGHTIAQFSAKLKCPHNLWDGHKGRLKGKSAEALRVNRTIEKINLAIHGCYKSLAASWDTVTAEAVKNGFQGIASVQHSVLKFYAEHNEHFSQRISVDRASGTLKKFEVSLRHLTTFIREKYRVKDISFARLDLTFIQAYDNYLRVEKRLQPGSVVNILGNLRKIVRIALNKGIISSYKEYEKPFPLCESIAYMAEGVVLSFWGKHKSVLNRYPVILDFEDNNGQYYYNPDKTITHKWPEPEKNR